MYRYFDVIWAGVRFGLPVKDINKISLQNIKSARGSDIFAYLLQKKYSRIDPFYVEFRAMDGVIDSQTYLLERMGWKGLLSEPNPKMYSQLTSNRNAFTTDLCVWSKSGKRLKFTVANNPGYSTISSFRSFDKHASKRTIKSEEIMVSTISLNDLFLKFKVPNSICYLSIDTEGSELDILKEFDFAKYNILFIYYM